MCMHMHSGRVGGVARVTRGFYSSGEPGGETGSHGQVETAIRNPRSETRYSTDYCI